MGKKIYVLVFTLIVLQAKNAIAQDDFRGQIRFCYNVSSMKTPAFDLVIGEANDSMATKANDSTGFTVANYYKPLGTLNGFGMNAMVIVSNLTFEFGFLNQRSTSMSDGQLSTYAGSYWSKKLKLNHFSFYIGCGYRIVNEKGFKIAPGFTLDLSMLESYSKSYLQPKYAQISQTAAMASRLYLDIDVGNKIGFFVRPFYQIPFWSHNLWKLEQKINPTGYVNHTKSEYKVNVTNFGLMFGLSFF